MSPHRRSRPPVRALLGALMVAPPIAVFAAIPWLKEQPSEVVFLLTGIAGALTVGASFTLAILHDRQTDEWERSNARFSSQWGWTAGAGLVALLLSFPPFRDLIFSVVAALTKIPDPDRTVVVLAFTFGFGAVVIAQALITILLSIGWALWMSRAPRDPS